MRVTDTFMAFPRLILALAFVAVLGPGIVNAILAIAITAWPPYARIARAETLTERGSDFIAAIRLQGASPLRVLCGHIVPLCVSSLIVRITLDMAGVILVAAGLGFLGLGARPPQPEWGAMVSEGRQFLLDQWWIATIPGAAIFLVSLGFNLLGDGLGPLSRPQRPRRSRARDRVRGRPREGGDRRRVGLWEDADGPRDPAPRPAAGAGDRAPARVRRDRPARNQRARYQADPRPAHLDGDAGPEVLAEPRDAGRQANRRGLPGALPGLGARGARARARHAGGGADPRPASRLRPPPP